MWTKWILISWIYIVKIKNLLRNGKNIVIG